jgi:membrane-associated phospholipid phosphatase
MRFFTVFALVLGLTGTPLAGQETDVPAASPTKAAFQNETLLKRSLYSPFVTLVRDHERIWTAPFRAGKREWLGALPLVAGIAVALPLDRRIANSFPNTPDQIAYSKGISHAGDHRVLLGLAGTWYAAGELAGSDRAAKTGIIAMQAIAHSHSVGQMLKFAAGRERPDYGDGQGHFGRGQQGFPSGHAASTWAVATVISRQYPDKPALKYGIYALPVAISASRLTAQRHFTSDVIAGGVIGHLIGTYLVNRHGGSAGKGIAARVTPDVHYDPRIKAMRFGVVIAP